MRSDRLGPYSLDTLRALPVPDIYERDPLKIRDRMIKYFEEQTGRTLYQGQVEMYLIETCAYGYSLAMEEAQAQALQYLVAFATGSGLDALGGNRWTPLLAAAKAGVMLRFTLVALRNVDIIIPAGTRVRSDDADIVFLTQADGVIAANSRNTDVLALADTAGALANTIPTCTITTMLDPVAGVTVSNPAAPAGGADRESDDAYRLRIANAPERISRAGPADAYRETVMAVSSAIVDCAVVRPKPCYIDIYVLTADGSAGEALMLQVMQALDPEKARPMGDEVTIKPCEPLTCKAAITIRARTSAAVIKHEAYSRVEAVRAEWRSKLSGIIAPSDLADPIKHIAGVLDVQVDGLSFMQLAPSQYMLMADITIKVELVNGG